MYKQSMYKTLQVVVIVVTGFLYTWMVAIVRKGNRQRGQENHAKIKKNNNGQIMYMYICL